MRSTLDIDGNLLKEAAKISGIKIKKDLINLTLEEFIRHARLENLKSRFGSKPVRLTLKHLEKMRRDEQ